MPALGNLLGGENLAVAGLQVPDADLAVVVIDHIALLSGSLAAESHYRVFLGGASGGDDPGKQGQGHADGDEQQRRLPGKIGAEVSDARQVVEDQVNGQAEQVGDAHPQDAGAEADDHRLGVEHPGDVFLGRADGPEDADLLGALLDGSG